MKKLILLPVLFLAIFTNLTTAQNVNIPDANFKAYLVGNSSINTNADTEIQVSEAIAYSGAINVSSLSISDLTGIEKFTNITSIDFSANLVTSVNLSYNTTLTNVNCFSNSLTCLDLSDNPNLTTLNCQYNNLTSLNLKNGNNTILTSYNSIGAGSMLYCIQVDNPAWSNANWTSKDTWSTYNTTCGTYPTASFTSDAPVCTGTPITFTNTSSFASSYVWDFDNGNFDYTTNPTYTYPSTGSYNVSLIARNCNGRDTFTVQINQGTSMYGMAFSPAIGSPVSDGVVILFPYQSGYISFDTLDLQPLDSFGYFTFGHVAQGNYIVKVLPGPTFPTLYPTYADSTWAWDSAYVFNHGCTADTYPSVTMLEYPTIGTGAGYVEGFVIEGVGFGRAQGDPVHGVDVKLGLTASTQIVRATETDTNGEFQFTNLPNGSYTVFVDIAGLERDSVYSFTIDNTNSQYTGLYYGVDSNSVYIIPDFGVEDESSEDSKNLMIQPNPVKDQAMINYTIVNDGKVQIDIYNSTGTKVQSLVNGSLNPGQYQLSYNPSSASLKPGLYFVTMTSNGKTLTKRFIVLN